MFIVISWVFDSWKIVASCGMPLAELEYERACLLITTWLINVGFVDAEIFRLGYITGSKRRPGDWEYSRPGLQISGAITLAVDEVNYLQ